GGRARALAEVLENGRPIEAAVAVAHRQEEAAAVASELDADGGLDADADARAGRHVGEARAAGLVARSVVEPVHHHLVEATLEEVEVLAAQPEGPTAFADPGQAGGFLAVVADLDGLDVDLRAGGVLEAGRRREERGDGGGDGGGIERA